MEPVPQAVEPPEDRKAREKAGKMLGVSGKSVSATAALKAQNYYSELAKEEQRKAGKEHSDNLKQFKTEEPQEKEHRLPEPVPEAEDDRHDREARARAGKMLGVSGKSVSDAKYIMEHGQKAARMPPD